MPLRYDRVAESFKACQTTSPAVKKFIAQFERDVAERINGETYMSSETNKLIDEFFKPENVVLTAEFLAHSSESRNRMIAAFRDQMRDRLRSEHPEDDWQSNFMCERSTSRSSRILT